MANKIFRINGKLVYLDHIYQLKEFMSDDLYEAVVYLIRQSEAEAEKEIIYERAESLAGIKMTAENLKSYVEIAQRIRRERVLELTQEIIDYKN